MKGIYTLTFLLESDNICLGMKKRGFGLGYWNGFGGKVEKDETVRKAAIREIFEESSVTINERDLEEVALIDFHFVDDTILEVYVFLVHQWKGEPVETNEMKPAWFSLNEIPYDHMWADDPYWLPRVLNGEKLTGSVWFKDDGVSIDRMEWNRPPPHKLE